MGRFSIVKKITFHFIIFCFGTFSLAQDQNALDTLKVQMYSKSLIVKVNALNELSRIYTGTNNEKAMEFVEKSVQLAKRSKNKQLLAQSINRLGTVYDYNEKIDSAQLYYLKALRIFEKLNDKSGIAAVYQNIGVMYYFQNDPEKAIDYYFKAIVLRKKTKEFDFVAKLQNNVAIIYRQQKKYDLAIQLYKESLAIKLKFTDQEAIANAYSNLASAYSYKQVYDSAQLNLKKAIDINSKLKIQINLAGNHLQLAEIYYSMQNSSLAKKELLTCIKHAEKAESNSALFNAYVLMWNIDTTAHDYKSAVQHQLLASTYREKTLDEEKSKTVEKLNILYETEKKDKEIIGLNAQQTTKKLENQILSISLLTAIIILFFSLFFYAKLRSKNKLLDFQKNEISSKTSELNRQASEIARHQSQMNPHFIFNALVSVQSFVLKENKENVSDYISQLAKLMRQTLTNSEKELINIQEEKQFLEAYIAFEKQRFENTFDLDFHCDEVLDLENTLIPPMILQPFLENAIKHGLSDASKKGNISLHFQKIEGPKNSSLHIELKDNGIGRKQAEKAKGNIRQEHQSMGIEITINRIKNTNLHHQHDPTNSFEIIDLVDQQGNSTGTLVKIKLPLLERF